MAFHAEQNKRIQTEEALRSSVTLGGDLELQLLKEQEVSIRDIILVLKGTDGMEKKMMK